MNTIQVTTRESYLKALSAIGDQRGLVLRCQVMGLTPEPRNCGATGDRLVVDLGNRNERFSWDQLPSGAFVQLTYRVPS